MSRECIVITLMSDDNTGIVEKVSHLISQHGGSWLDSRLARLSGKFAGILNVSIDSTNIAGLTSALSQLQGSGIDVSVTLENKRVAIDEATKPVNFELIGADRQGIVHEISQALSAQKINILDMVTECSSMPWSGDPQFSAKGKLGVPEGLDIDQLNNQLDTIANQLGIDFTLTSRAS